MNLKLEERVQFAFSEASNYVKYLEDQSSEWVTLSDVAHVVSLFEAAFQGEDLESLEAPEEVETSYCSYYDGINCDDIF